MLLILLIGVSYSLKQGFNAPLLALGWSLAIPSLLGYIFVTLFSWSCQGVQQCDPLGPLLFALILYPLVLKIHQSCKLNLQAWYLDDVTMLLTPF